MNPEDLHLVIEAALDQVALLEVAGRDRGGRKYSDKARRIREAVDRIRAALGGDEQ